MTADNRRYSEDLTTPTEPVGLRASFAQRHGIAIGWRTGVAVLLGAALLLCGLLFYAGT